eukprot:402766_1
MTSDANTVELVAISSTEMQCETDEKTTEQKEIEKAKKKKYKKLFVMRVLIRLTVIAIMITLIIKLNINLNDYLDWLLHEIDAQFGPIWSPVLLCTLFSFWTSLSPMGYLPTVLCGILFNWYIAPIVAYVSINIGSVMNIVLIRYIILRYKDKYCCIKRILTMCCGKKMGQVSFLKKLFIASSPIKTIILLRLPYLNNGVLNYLFSLQVDSISIKQNMIGNAIGFIPGAILFTVFGAEIKSLTKIIAHGGFDNQLQMILFIVIFVLTCFCYICIALKVKSLIGKATSVRTKGIVNTSDR